MTVRSIRIVRVCICNRNLDLMPKNFILIVLALLLSACSAPEQVIETLVQEIPTTVPVEPIDIQPAEATVAVVDAAVEETATENDVVVVEPTAEAPTAQPVEPTPAPTAEPVADPTAVTETEPVENEEAPAADAAEPATNAQPAITSVGTGICPTEYFMTVQADPANGAYPAPSLTVTCNADSFTVNTNSIPNYEFVPMTPNQLVAADLTFNIPLNPTVAAEPISIVNSIGSLGVLINGVQFNGPNEAAIGGYGDPFLDELLDFCGGHTGGRGDYHAHSAPACLYDNWQQANLVVGYAIDGYPVLAPFVCADDACSSVRELRSSWQRTTDVVAAWEAHEYIAGSGDLDECNGMVQPDGSYAYYATATFPYMLGCIKGTPLQITFQSGDAAGQGGPPAGNGQQGQPPQQEGGNGGGQPPRGGGGGGGPQGGQPDFAAAAATLGITEQALRDALGGPPPNFEAAAATLGISVEVLQAALGN